nr:MAG TPA: hypothetical protein [Caudoviricetes sp.]
MAATALLRISHGKNSFLPLCFRMVFPLFSPVSIGPGLDPLVGGPGGILINGPLGADLLRRDAALGDEQAHPPTVLAVLGGVFLDGQ